MAVPPPGDYSVTDFSLSCDVALAWKSFFFPHFKDNKRNCWYGLIWSSHYFTVIVFPFLSLFCVSQLSQLGCTLFGLDMLHKNQKIIYFAT